MVAPWQRICAVTSGDDPRICGWRTAYEGTSWGIYAAILAVAILVWELLPVVIPKLGMRGWQTAIVTALLSIALAVCVLVKLITDNEFQTIWAWIGFAIALAITVTALIRVRHRWKTRHKAAAPVPEPWVSGRERRPVAGRRLRSVARGSARRRGTLQTRQEPGSSAELAGRLLRCPLEDRGRDPEPEAAREEHDVDHLTDRPARRQPLLDRVDDVFGGLEEVLGVPERHDGVRELTPCGACQRAGETIDRVTQGLLGLVPRRSECAHRLASVGTDPPPPQDDRGVSDLGEQHDEEHDADDEPPDRQDESCQPRRKE